MQFRKSFHLLVIITLILSSSPVLFHYPVTDASPEPVNEDRNPPVSGTGYTDFNITWYVDTNETLIYRNQTVNLTGDLIINSTGTLILDNVTLYFNSSSNAEFGIIVESGGQLNITNSTLSASNNTWSFKVYGNLSMDDCNISKMFGQVQSSEYVGGLEVYSGNVSVNNSLFFDNMNNIYLHYMTNYPVVITNNTIFSTTVTQGRGIVITNHSKPIIANNNISGLSRGIEILENSEPVISNNNLLNFTDYGIYTNSLAKNIMIKNNSIGKIVKWDAIRIDYNWIASDGPGVVIEDNELFESDDYGINYNSNIASTIINNRIYNNTNGVYIDGSKSLIAYNVIENNTRGGLTIEWSINNPDPLVRNNVIEYNGVQTGVGGYGVTVNSASGRITDNKIHHNGPETSTSDQFMGGGIYVVSSGAIANPVIDNNTLEYNQLDGIDIDSGSFPTIKDNVIYHSNRTGIYVYDANVPVSGNIVRYNSKGIYFYNSNLWIVHCTIEENSDYGINLDMNSKPTIYDNKISRNGDGGPDDAGIFLNGAIMPSSAVIISNDISNNTGTGIRVAASTPQILNNEINYNINGITFPSIGGVVKNNGIRFNTGSGIITEHTLADPLIENNIFDSNNNGILIDDDARPNVVNNWFRKNNYGVKVTGNSWPVVHSNQFSANSVGLRSDYSRIDADKLTFTVNTLYGMELKGTNFTIYTPLENSTFSNPAGKDIKVDDNSHVNLLNTTFDRTKLVVADSKSEIIPYWYLHVKAKETDGTPLLFGTVKIENVTDQIIGIKTLNVQGMLNYYRIKEFRLTQSERIDYTPHDVFVEKTGFVKYKETVTMDQSRRIDISLGFNLDPGPVSNILPRRSHGLTPKITWDPAVDPDGDSLTYIINIGTTAKGTDILDSSIGQTTKPEFQITTPLSFGTGNNTYHITVYAFDGFGGESIAETTMFIVNDAPSIPKIKIEPERPNKLSDIDCLIQSPSMDNDNDSVVYDFKWYKDGVYQPTLSLIEVPNLNSSITPAFLDDGQVWKCIVRAFDGYFYSPSVESNEVTVKNFAPKINYTPLNREIKEDSIADSVFNLNDVFADENNEDLTFVWNTSKYVDVVNNNSVISFVPDPNWFGEAKFKFTARDYFDEVSFIFILTVSPVNDLPVIEPIGNLEANEDRWFNYTFSAYDYADSETVTVKTNLTETIPGLADTNYPFYEFNIQTFELKFKPDNSMVGKFIINVTAEDSSKGRSFEILNFTINNINDNPTPIITSPSAEDTYFEGNVIILDGSGSFDEDSIHGDSFKSVQWVIESTGQVIGTDLVDNYTFTKAGTYTIKLVIVDAFGSESFSSVTINVARSDGDGSEEGIFGNLSENPSMLWALIILIVIIIMVLIVVIVNKLRQRKEKLKMVEAGLIDMEDIKTKPETGEPAGKEPEKPQAPSFPQPIQVDVKIAGVTQPPLPGTEGADMVPPPPPADVPTVDVTESMEKDAAAEPEAEPMDFKRPEKIIEMPEEDETVYEHGPEATEAGGSEPEAGTGEAIGEGEIIDETSGSFKQILCPSCGMIAQDHPQNKNLIICPVCGEKERK